MEPRLVQDILDTCAHRPAGEYRGAVHALKAKQANCLEAAFAGAYLLEQGGEEPVLLSLPGRHGSHAVALYEERLLLGAVGRSSIPDAAFRAAFAPDPTFLAHSYLRPLARAGCEPFAYGVVPLDEWRLDWRFGERLARGDILDEMVRSWHHPFGKSQ